MYYNKPQSYIIAQMYVCTVSDIQCLDPFFLSSINRQVQLESLHNSVDTWNHCWQRKKEKHLLVLVWATKH